MVSDHILCQDINWLIWSLSFLCLYALCVPLPKYNKQVKGFQITFQLCYMQQLTQPIEVTSVKKTTLS